MNFLLRVCMLSVNAILGIAALLKEVESHLRELSIGKNILFLLDPLRALLAQRFKLRLKQISRTAGNDLLPLR